MKIMQKTSQIAPFLFLAGIITSTALTYCDNNRELRKSLDYGYVDENGKIEDPSIKIVEAIPQGKRYGVCHDYAISKLLGLKGLIPETFPIRGNGDWYDEFNFLEDYCQEVSETEKEANDLAIYKNNHGFIRHTGLVVDSNTIESKWGTCPAILSHPPLTVPLHYGDNIHYYRLTTPPHIVIEDMKKKTAHSNNIRRKCRIVNEWLVHHATHSWIDFLKETLEANMCADVNTRNSEKQSLLMIAAKNDDTPMVKMLLDYNADVNRQDTHGNTALHLAAKNGSGAIMRALYKKNCNKDLKDNNGHDAFHYYRDYGSVCP